MTETSDDEIEIEIERAPNGESEGARNAGADGDDDSADVDRATRSSRERSDGASALDGTDDPPADDRAVKTPERRLEDELGRIGVSTTSDGYVEGRVTGLESVGEATVRLEVSLPHGETVAFTLDKPIPWSDEFLLTRIVEDVGYDAASISHLIGERVYLARTDAERGATGSDADGGWRWLSEPTRAAGDAVLASLGSRFRLEERRSPEWRLVDPRERRTDEGDTDRLLRDPTTIGTTLIVLAPLIVAIGVAYGLTGGLAMSGPVIGFALLGAFLALLGASALTVGDD